MNRELLLMRHGKSDWSVDVDDFNRPLKNRGKRGAQRMGAWLKPSPPDYIVSSPAERAINTAEKLSKAMGLTAQNVHKDPRIYDADLNMLKKILADCPKQAKRVLLIGHNPGLEALLEYLNNYDLNPDSDGKLLATATLASINMPKDWNKLKQGCGHVVSITRADTLGKLFPFNGLTGLEYRERPAYYYSQSAVIPYRIIDKELQILLISSSSNKHWGVPKGIVEPGMTPCDSAAKEAKEEAGIDGIISEQLFDCYQYEKWGGQCHVQVFPLAVTHMDSDRDWEENHRQRKWLTLKKAVSLVKQDSLRELFKSFAKQLNRQS